MHVSQVRFITEGNWLSHFIVFGLMNQDYSTPFDGLWTCLCVVKVDKSDDTLMHIGVVLSWVVGYVMFSWLSEDFELALFGLVFLTSSSNVINSYGSLFFYRTCEDTVHGDTVCFQWCWWLMVGGWGYPSSMRYCWITRVF